MMHRMMLFSGLLMALFAHVDRSSYMPWMFCVELRAKYGFASTQIHTTAHAARSLRGLRLWS